VDRFAIFVDAGYVLAGSAELITGVKTRSAIQVNYQSLVSSIVDMLEHRSGLQLLRLYWYDGARLAVPTQEHLLVARLPNVKLRLGRIVHGGQKGVDSLIVLDLTTLARERAMSTAYLISGDEDIREGVAAAQQMGVRIGLLGIPSQDGPPKQADTLVREADEHIVLDRVADIDPHIRAVQPVLQPLVPSGTPPPTARQVGHAFGVEWAGAATPAEVANLKAQVPRIPTQLDAQLFQKAEQTLGPLRGRLADRRELRAGFWDALMAS